MPASSLKLAQRNAALLLMSFINAGVTTLVPQRFFARTAPETKQFWLATTLLLGTLGAIAGVSLARRLQWRPVGGLRTLFLAAALLLWTGLHVSSLVLFVFFHVAVRAVVNFATQDLDARAAIVAGASDRTGNDRIGTLLRFVGMLVGPVWFGLVTSTGWPLTLMLLTLTALSMLSAGALAGSASPPPAPAGQTPLTFHDRLLVLGGIAIFGTYYLLASNMLYVLTDLHHMPRATAFAGLLITTVYGSAVVVTLAMALLRHRELGLRWMIGAPISMAFVAFALHWPVAASTPVAVSGAVVLGAAFAFFLLAFRNYASRAAQAGADQWIAVYNNLGNTSALAGFSVMALMASLARLWHVSDTALLTPGLAGLSALGVLLTLRTRRSPGPGSAAVDPTP